MYSEVVCQSCELVVVALKTIPFSIELVENREFSVIYRSIYNIIAPKHIQSMLINKIDSYLEIQ